ncbi:MAG: CHC2 zinc finger domain-containing protein [Patescibacteria group bacterium]
MTNSNLITDIDDDFYDYVLELEKEWRRTQPKYTDSQLLDIFPEAKDIIPEKIFEWGAQRDELIKIIKSKLALIKREAKDENSRMFWREWVKACEGKELLEVENQIVRLKRLQWVSKPRTIINRSDDNHVTEDDIQQALQVPIESLLASDRAIRHSGRNLACLCPLHTEKRASFFIYPETNSCWCFGCNQGGNGINLVRLLHQYNFPDAVKFLIGKL